jgi:hypothetical protein
MRAPKSVDLPHVRAARRASTRLGEVGRAQVAVPDKALATTDGDATEHGRVRGSPGNRTSAGDTRNGAPDVTTFDEYDAANRPGTRRQDAVARTDTLFGASRLLRPPPRSGFVQQVAFCMYSPMHSCQAATPAKARGSHRAGLPPLRRCVTSVARGTLSNR